MSDQYRLDRLAELLHIVVRTTGLALINNPNNFYSDVGMDSDILNIMALIRKMEEMVTNPLSLQYVDGTRFSTGDRETWKNEFYTNNAEIVCLLPEKVRNNVYFIYSGGRRSLKYLDILSQRTNAVALYIDDLKKSYVIPFSPTVTKLFCPGVVYQDVSLYLNTLVELTVGWFDVRTYEFILNAKNLRYISFVHVPVYDKGDTLNINISNITRMLEARRECSGITLLGFRFSRYFSGLNPTLADRNYELLKELCHHKLSVLEVPLYNLEGFKDLIVSQHDLETLIVYVDMGYIRAIVDIMKDEVQHLSRFSIQIVNPITSHYDQDVIDGIDANFIRLLKDHPNIKEFKVSGMYDDAVPSDEVIRLLESNIARSNLGDETILTQIKKLVTPLDPRTNFLGSNGSLLRCTDVIPTKYCQGEMTTCIPDLTPLHDELYSTEELMDVQTMIVNQELESKQEFYHNRPTVTSKDAKLKFDPNTTYYE